MTSDKNGVEPPETKNLVKHIVDNCPNLELCGLMTIGAYDYDISLGPNPDFLVFHTLQTKKFAGHNFLIFHFVLETGGMS